MIELQQLQHLIAFSKYGTLSKAAEKLHTSQPALSRSMQKLEEGLQVPIFDRQKNKMILNKNGELTLEYAKRVLDLTSEMIASVQLYDRKYHTISFGSCSPAPTWSLTSLLTKLFPDMTIFSEMKDTESLIKGLRDGLYQFIILTSPVNEPEMYSFKYGEEHLALSLPLEHPLNIHKSVYFKDIDGENMILFSRIGFWYEVCLQKMPSSHFIIQHDHFSFRELLRTSSLPCFTSDFSDRNWGHAPDRISIPILDPEANVTYYIICLERTKKMMLKEIMKIKKTGMP